MVFCHRFCVSQLEKNGLPNSNNSFLLPQQALQKQYTTYNLQVNHLSEETVPPPPSGIMNGSNVSCVTFKMITIYCIHSANKNMSVI